MVLRTSGLRTRHFVHARRGACATAPETAEHPLAKAAIAAGVRGAGWTARVEQEGRTPSGEAWVADVLATREGKRPAAFEVQWSPQSDAETRARQRRYEAAGVRGMRFFRQPDFPWCEKAVPAFRLALDELDARLMLLLLPPPDDPAGTARKESD